MKLYYMASTVASAREIANYENPNMVVISVKLKSTWDRGQNEYEVTLKDRKRPKRTGSTKPRKIYKGRKLR